MKLLLLARASARYNRILSGCARRRGIRRGRTIAGRLSSLRANSEPLQDQVERDPGNEEHQPDRHPIHRVTHQIPIDDTHLCGLSLADRFATELSDHSENQEASSRHKNDRHPIGEIPCENAFVHWNTPLDYKELIFKGEQPLMLQVVSRFLASHQSVLFLRDRLGYLKSIRDRPHLQELSFDNIIPVEMITRDGRQ